MTSPTDLSVHTNVASLGTSPTIYPFTPGSNYTFPKPVRFIRASVAGNIQFTDAYGNNVTGAWATGETRAVAAIAIIDGGTTATGIEGMP